MAMIEFQRNDTKLPKARLSKIMDSVARMVGSSMGGGIAQEWKALADKARELELEILKDSAKSKSLDQLLQDIGEIETPAPAGVPGPDDSVVKLTDEERRLQGIGSIGESDAENRKKRKKDGAREVMNWLNQ